VLGLVLGPGAVLGVGLVVLGVSVPMPPAALPPELEPEDELPMPDELLPPLSEGMVALPPERVPDLPLDPLAPLSPGVEPPEPPPVMPAHATISIAQATDINHLIITITPAK
jgi:hypothetical protein